MNRPTVKTVRNKLRKLTSKKEREPPDIPNPRKVHDSIAPVSLLYYLDLNWTRFGLTFRI